ncbi:dUTP diphosphatase [uncultured Halomonas sp.]|uniref:dUTP diphosphatase n=1 Tax=uncultured Halomonas sp. TaxID=173971 RepID=UPI0026192C80|nr:dUTP diphosphatase [uncultured Halomonas sp.]
MIQFKRLTPDATLPTRATDGSAGFDLYCTARIDLPPGQRMLLPTGIAVALPPSTCGQIWPRSGMADRQGIDRLAGLIDEDYRGEIHVSLVNHGMDLAEFRPGDRIAQLVVVPCWTEAREVGELPETERGVGGFGSSGR